MNYWQRGNIRLRNLEDKDLTYFLETRNEPDSIREFLEDYIEPPYSDAEIKDMFAGAIKEFSQNDKRIFIIETLDGKRAGSISVWLTNKRNHYFKYGVFTDKEYRGKGMAKSALIVVLDYYFNELNYHKASPMVYAFNKGSQAFHEKLGFIKEGVIREELYTRGIYHDMIYYGMTKDEFNALYTHFDYKNFDAVK